MTFLYSPLPIQRYHLIGLDVDEVSVVMQSGIVCPLWNLFWLSNPGLDRIPENGDRWWRVYRPDGSLLSSLIRDSFNDSVLCHKLIEHPFAFSSWFETQTHRDYVTYETHGGRRWVDLVLNRADEAATRIIKERPLRFTADGRLQILAD